MVLVRVPMTYEARCSHAGIFGGVSGIWTAVLPALWKGLISGSLVIVHDKQS